MSLARAEQPEPPESPANAQAGRSLSGFTVDLDVYSGPYEWLLALILKDEVEIFEVPLKEIVSLYLDSRPDNAPDSLDRDTDFTGSATALVLLKSRSLLPALDPEPDDADDEILSPEQLADRVHQYLKIKRGAEALRDRFEANAGFHPSAHFAPPRPGKLRIRQDKLAIATRRTFSRLVEPPVEPLGTITLTLQDLAAVIRTSLAHGSISYEELTGKMDRLHSAVAFAAALSLAHEGRLTLHQSEPLGPLTLEPVR